MLDTVRVGEGFQVHVLSATLELSLSSRNVWGYGDSSPTNSQTSLSWLRAT